jgi:uncharacterized coiled-coil DUF342 family protein
MAYSEIINEIQEQINDTLANIEQYELDITQMQAEIEEKQTFIAQFQQRIEGLTQLRVNAQTLSDEAGSSVVVNVTNAFSQTTTV